VCVFVASMERKGEGESDKRERGSCSSGDGGTAWRKRRDV
jgi:hypothetical protein